MNQRRQYKTGEQAPNVSGIYRIICTTNGKVYVGNSLSIRARWTNHQTTVRLGIHKNRYLTNAWRKYGPDAFVLEVLELVLPVAEILAVREQYWIDYYHSANRKRGYNLAPTAGSNAGCKMPEGMADKHARDYIVTAPNGLETAVRNLSRFTRRMNFSKAQQVGLFATAAGKTQSMQGWSARPIDKTPEEMHELRLFWRSRKSRAKVRWIAVDPNGVRYEVKSLKNFSEYHGLVWSSMRKLVRGDMRYYRGWQCLRADQFSEEALQKQKQRETLRFKRLNGTPTGLDNHPMAILNSDTVRDICRRYDDKLASRKQLADEHSVCLGCIGNILCGYTWSMVTGRKPKRERRLLSACETIVTGGN